MGPYDEAPFFCFSMKINYIDLTNIMGGVMYV